MIDNHKILIVEDDSDFREFLRKLLSLKNFDVFGVNRGYDAMKYLNSNPVDLVLLDVQMPDVDGYWIMEQVKHKFPDLLVIMMTGYASIDSAIKALKKGAYDYLEKPFATEKLLKTIQNALDRKRLENHGKRTLKKLGESEEKYYQLFESVTDALMIFDAETRIFENANSGALKLFGYTLEEVCKLKVEDISAEKEKTEARVERIRRDEKNSRFIPLRYLRKKDGTIFPVEITSASFISEGRDKVIGWIRDITKRRQSEEKLQESEKRFRDLVENSLVGIAIIQDHKIVYRNQVHARLYGAIKDRAVNGIYKVIHPDDLVKIKKAYEQAISGTRKALETDFRFYPSGKLGNRSDLRWVQCRAAKFNYGGQDALLIISAEITEAKQLEHQLIIKNKMLSLGRVAAGIAHEIRNPLTGINSYLFTLAELCRTQAPDTDDIEMMQQIVDQIQVASNKIESVIKRVMDFSKPGAPKMVSSDINASLEEAIKLSEVTLRKNGIKLEKDLARQLPNCYIDPQLIEQVMLNLITNAARAMENGYGSKKIEVRSYSKKNTVCIGVSDSGPGVPQTHRDKIFDPFFTTKEDGQGIGLNIAQRIIADHNGSLTLDTSKWGGAEFKIELPVEKRMDPR